MTRMKTPLPDGWTDRQERHWHTMLHPEKWQFWPFLTLQRHRDGHLAEVAVLLATHHFHNHPDHKKPVRIAYGLTANNEARLADAPWQEVSPADLIDDGWEVV